MLSEKNFICSLGASSVFRGNIPLQLLLRRLRGLAVACWTTVHYDPEKHRSMIIFDWIRTRGESPSPIIVISRRTNKSRCTCLILIGMKLKPAHLHLTFRTNVLNRFRSGHRVHVCNLQSQGYRTAILSSESLLTFGDLGNIAWWQYLSVSVGIWNSLNRYAWHLCWAPLLESSCYCCENFPIGSLTRLHILSWTETCDRGEWCCSGGIVSNWKRHLILLLNRGDEMAFRSVRKLLTDMKR